MCDNTFAEIELLLVYLVYYISDKRVQTKRKFWEDISRLGSSVEQMVLCSDAEKINQREVPEVLSLLPDYAGKDVLELGAGIGLVFSCMVLPVNNMSFVMFAPYSYAAVRINQ